MGDAELRTLERAVHAGEAGARVRLAAELERLGRRDDAIAALLPGCADVEVRRAVGALPCWARGGMGRTDPRYLDAPSPAGPPALAWVTPVRADGAHGQTWEVLASPLGIALAGCASRLVLDATSGKPRERLLPGALFAPVELVGGVLVVKGSGHRAWGIDPWTCEVLHETTAGKDFTVAGGLFAAVEQRREKGARHEVLVARRLVDPRQPPVTAWTREGRGSIAFAGRGLARIMYTGAGDPVIDPSSGAELFRPRGVAAMDDDGVLTQQQDLFTLLGADGRERWSRRYELAAVALGPDTVLTVTPRPPAHTDTERDVPELVALERATGEVRWRRGPFARMFTLSTSLVRDAVYVLADDALQALDLATGQQRWRVDLTPLGLAGAHVVRPLSRRFYGIAVDRVFCLRSA